MTDIEGEMIAARREMIAAGINLTDKGIMMDEKGPTDSEKSRNDSSASRNDSSGYQSDGYKLHDAEIAVEEENEVGKQGEDHAEKCAVVGGTGGTGGTVEKKKRTGGGPPTRRAEIVLRLRIIEGLMFRGFLGRDIQRALETQFKKQIPWTTIQKYIRHIATMWEEEDALARPYRRSRQLRQLHDAADELKVAQQWREWIEVQRLIARIEGNLAPTQSEVTVQGRFDGWTIEELEEYVKTQKVPERILGVKKSEEIRLLPGGSGEETN